MQNSAVLQIHSNHFYFSESITSVSEFITAIRSYGSQGFDSPDYLIHGNFFGGTQPNCGGPMPHIDEHFICLNVEGLGQDYVSATGNRFANLKATALVFSDHKGNLFDSNFIGDTSQISLIATFYSKLIETSGTAINNVFSGIKSPQTGGVNSAYGYNNQFGSLDIDSAINGSVQGLLTANVILNNRLYNIKQPNSFYNSSLLHGNVVEENICLNIALNVERVIYAYHDAIANHVENLEVYDECAVIYCDDARKVEGNVIKNVNSSAQSASSTSVEANTLAGIWSKSTGDYHHVSISGNHISKMVCGDNNNNGPQRYLTGILFTGSSFDSTEVVSDNYIDSLVVFSHLTLNAPYQFGARGIYVAGVGILNPPAERVKVENNSILNVRNLYTLGAASAVTGLEVHTISPDCSVRNNLIKDLIGPRVVHGLRFTGTAYSNSSPFIENNRIDSIFTLANNDNSIAEVVAIGINNSGSTNTAPFYVRRNRISNILCNTTLTQPKTTYGIHIDNIKDLDISNNQVNLAPYSGTGQNAQHTMHAINLKKCGGKVYYNTLFLHGSATNAASHTSCLHRFNTTSNLYALDIRNNIMDNSLVHQSGAGMNTAIFLDTVYATDIIDHNLYYLDTTGSGAFYSLDNGDSFDTVFVFPFDEASAIGNPDYQSGYAQAEYLILDSISPALGLGTGNISVVDDYFGMTRPANSTAGAYELPGFCGMTISTENTQCVYTQDGAILIQACGAYTWDTVLVRDSNGLVIDTLLNVGDSVYIDSLFRAGYSLEFIQGQNTYFEYAANIQSDQTPVEMPDLDFVEPCQFGDLRIFTADSSHVFWSDNMFTDTLGFDSSFTVSNYSEQQTYYIVRQEGSCYSGVDSISPTYITLPPAPLITGDSIVCQGDYIHLYVDGNVPSNWLNEQLTPLGTTLHYQALATQDTTLLCYLTQNGCYGDTILYEVNVTIPESLDIFFIEDTLFCSFPGIFEIFRDNALILTDTLPQIMSVSGTYRLRSTDSNGCVVYSPDLEFILQDTVTDTLDVIPVIRSKDYLVYPNPSSGIVNIESAYFITRAVWTDVSGRIVTSVSVPADKKATISTPSSPGVYLLHIYSGISGINAQRRVLVIK